METRNMKAASSNEDRGVFTMFTLLDPQQVPYQKKAVCIIHEGYAATMTLGRKGE